MNHWSKLRVAPSGFDSVWQQVTSIVDEPLKQTKGCTSGFDNVWQQVTSIVDEPLKQTKGYTQWLWQCDNKLPP